MRRPVDLYEVYDYRIKTVEALKTALSGEPNVDTFEAAIDLLRSASERLGDQRARTGYAGFAILLEAFLLLIRWERAVRGAEVDADRYLRAARQRLRDMLSDATTQYDEPLLTSARRLIEISDVGQAPSNARLLLAIPLPLPLHSVATWPRRSSDEEARSEPRTTVSVAFLSFTLHDIPFGSPQIVEPDLLYDLSVEVRVSRWPETAETLVLDVATVEPPDAYTLPIFTFGKPAGVGPHLLRSTGRMALKMGQARLSRPLEFAYRARFTPPIKDVDVRVEGQRRLLVQSYDPEEQPLTGYVQIDPIIMKIRSQARLAPGIRDQELDDFLRILIALANIAGQALQGNIFAGFHDEAAFQRILRALLRQRPDIGSELEEHPHAAGGITDLSFRGIPLELKAIADKPVVATDAENFLPQTAAYVAAADRRFGLLVVLDCATKNEAPGSAANDIFLRELPPRTGGSLSLLVGVVLIRGNLPKPSQL